MYLILCQHLENAESLRFPTLIVADCPVNPTSVKVAILIEPILVVAETPVKGTPISSVNEPTAEVAATPVSPIVGFEEIVISPVALDNPSPVIAVVLSDTGIGVPTADVAETPVKVTPKLIFNEPSAVVAETPVKANCYISNYCWRSYTRSS